MQHKSNCWRLVVAPCFNHNRVLYGTHTHNSVDLNYELKTNFRIRQSVEYHSIRCDCAMYFTLCLEFNLLHAMWGHFNCLQNCWKQCPEGKFGYSLTAMCGCVNVWSACALKKPKRHKGERTAHECCHFVSSLLSAAICYCILKHNDIKLHRHASEFRAFLLTQHE